METSRSNSIRVALSAVMAVLVALCLLWPLGPGAGRAYALDPQFYDIADGATDVSVDVGEIAVYFGHNVAASAIFDENAAHISVVDEDGNAVAGAQVTRKYYGEMAPDVDNPDPMGYRRYLYVSLPELTAGTTYTVVVTEGIVSEGNHWYSGASLTFTTAGEKPQPEPQPDPVVPGEGDGTGGGSGAGTGEGAGDDAGTGTDGGNADGGTGVASGNDGTRDVGAATSSDTAAAQTEASLSSSAAAQASAARGGRVLAVINHAQGTDGGTGAAGSGSVGGGGNTLVETMAVVDASWQSALLVLVLAVVVAGAVARVVSTHRAKVRRSRFER